MPAKATKAAVIKKKHWVRIFAESPFDERQIIGETLVEELANVIGKPILVNLMNLTGDMKHQNSNVKFVVDRIVEGRALTKIVGYEVISASLRRLVRRRSSKIDMSFDAVTADGIRLRIKPFVLARSMVNRSLLSAIRRQIEQNTKQSVASTGFQNLIQDIATNRFQITLKKSLSKLYPIKSFEVRILNVYANQTPKKIEEPVAEAKPEEPKEEVKEAQQPEEIKEEVKQPEIKEEKPAEAADQ